MSDNLEPSQDTYVRPVMEEGMTVRVSFDRAFTRPMLGLVNKAKDKSVDVLVFTDRGPSIYPSVRHLDDPFLLEHPEVHKRGVFLLSKTEEERITTRETLAKLMVIVEQQARDIAKLLCTAPNIYPEVPKHTEEAITDDSTESFMRRKPGRPRRQTAESAT